MIKSYNKSVCSSVKQLLDVRKKGILKAIEDNDWDAVHTSMLQIDEIVGFLSLRCNDEVLEEI